MKAEQFLKDDEQEKVLNGTTIRKGTVGTLIANLKIIESQPQSSADYQTALNDAKEQYQTLRSTGLLDYIDLTNPQHRALLLEE